MAFFTYLNHVLTSFIPLLGVFPTEVSGPILYALHKGESERAFETYLNYIKEGERHDFDLLQQSAKTLLEQGIDTKDPEIQALCIFGAGVAASSELIPILEKGIKSDNVKTQLIALNYLSKQQDDEADLILLEALSSPYLITRLEILLYLAQRNHPAVLEQLYSLIVKVPAPARPLFGEIAIHLDSAEAHRFMRQLLSDSDIDVRVGTLLAIAREKRDDFLPSVRALATGASFMQQEAAAYTLGVLKDSSSIELLKTLATSKQSSVKLAAAISLCKLGKKEYQEFIEDEAKNGNLFAIAALGRLKLGKDTLLNLLSHQERDVRLNATIGLLQQKEPQALKEAEEFIFDQGKDWGFWTTLSPAKALKAYRSIPSATHNTKNYPGLLSTTLSLKESMLEQFLEFGEERFLNIANRIIEKKQNDLIPLLFELMIASKSEKVIEFLKQGHKKTGAPLIRNYCTLALYRLKEPGPYEEQLILWVKEKGAAGIIQFREEESSPSFSSPHQLTPEETSRFLVETYQALATAQNQKGIETLIHAMAHGNPKNRYALAGLLMRTTE